MTTHDGTGPGHDATSPPAWLRKLSWKLRCTHLLPLKSSMLQEAGFRGEPAANWPTIAGDLSAPGFDLPFELGPAPEPGKLRLTVEGNLPGSPVALLVGPALHFFAGAPAAARLSFDDATCQKETEPVTDRMEHLAAELSLAADDASAARPSVVDPLAYLPGARSNELTWHYDADNDVLELDVAAPLHVPSTSVAIEFRSVQEPEVRELHIEILQPPRSSADRLLKSVSDLGPAALGRDVDVTIEPVRPDNPEHVRALLAKAVGEFVSLPLTPQADGSYLVDFRWPDQQAAAANPLAGWALQYAVEKEVA
jgi:hypothetical protein